MKQTILKIIAVLFTFGVLFTACDPGMIPAPINDSGDPEINFGIRSMTYFDQPASFDKVTVGPIAGDDPAYPDQPDPIEGKETQIYHAAEARSHEQNLLMDPSSTIIWLGSILDGNSITTGEYKPIIAKRAPMSFAISAVKKADGSTLGNVSTTVDSPNVVTVAQAHSNILGENSQNIQSAPLYTEFTKTEVNSESQMALGLGLSYKGWGATVKAGLDFSSSRKRTQIIAKFVQVCYTETVDVTSGGPGSYFDPSVNWADLQANFTGNASPVIVSQVKYGRMGLVKIKSDYSASSVAAALEASYSSFWGEGGGSISTENADILSNSEIEVMVRGGTYAASSGIASGYDGFVNWMNASTEDCGFLDAVPLAYTLTYLKDGSVANVVLAGEYYERVVVGEDTPPTVQPKYPVLKLTELESNRTSGAVISITTIRGYDSYGTTGGIWTASYDDYDFGSDDIADVNYFWTFNDGIDLSEAYLYVTVHYNDNDGGSDSYDTEGEESFMIYLTELNETGTADVECANCIFSFEGLNLSFID